MKKLIIALIIFVAILAVGKPVYDLSTDKEVTIGSVEMNTETEKSMRYSLFDGSKDYTMELTKGDRLNVDIVTEGGELSMEIINTENENEHLYSGIDLPTSSFSVGINTDGIYKVIVKGDKHKGSYSIVKSK